MYTDTSVFDSMVRMLSREFRVITYDHGGLGKSMRPVNESLNEAADDVANLIEELEVAPCHFVGNCLGAYVGLQLAIRHSDVLKSCTLMGVSPEVESKEAQEQYKEFFDAVKKDGMKAHAKEFADMWFGSSFKATKDPLEVMRREKWIHHVAQMKPDEVDVGNLIFNRPDVTKDLSKVSCPVLVLAGEEESPKALESYRNFADALPDAEFKTIPHAGYALVIEQPEDVVERVRNFVEIVEHKAARRTQRRPEAREDMSARLQ
jgi:3-oxoadipate enol-lactonase